MPLFFPNTQILTNTNFNNKVIQKMEKNYFSNLNEPSLFRNSIKINNKRITGKYTGPKEKEAKFHKYLLYSGSLIYLRQNPVNDQFIVEFRAGFSYLYAKPDGDINMDVTVKINNDSDMILKKSKMSNRDTGYINFYSTEFSKSLKYSEIKSFTVSCKLNYEVDLKFEVFIENDIQNEIKKNFIIDSSEGQEFRFSIQNGLSMSSNGNIIEPFYSDISLKMEEIKMGANNEKLLSFREGRDPFRRIKFEPKKIYGLPLKLDEDNKSDFEFQTILSKEEDEVFVKIKENSFYDLKSNETKFEINQKSAPGYVIPYNYDQDFYPTLEFNLNEIENITLTWVQKIDRPYFDKNKGKIKLKIKDENEEIKILEEKWNNIDLNFFEEKENKDLTYIELLAKLRKNKD